MRGTELPDGLGDRGIGVQAAGFLVVGCVCLTALQVWDGSNHWAYLWFEAASTRLYWAFIVPLAATFDWGRKMFEKGKAVREAKKAELLTKEREKERRRIQTELEKQGVALTPEVVASVFGDNGAKG